MADRLTAAERRVVRAAMRRWRLWLSLSTVTYSRWCLANDEFNAACAALERAQKGAKRGK